MTITCGGETFKAHCAVVCTQSSFFDSAITIGFQESASKTIDLPDDNPLVLQLFLQFLYTGNYEDGANPTWDKPSTVALFDSDEVEAAIARPTGALPLAHHLEEDLRLENPFAEEDTSADFAPEDHDDARERDEELGEEYNEYYGDGEMGDENNTDRPPIPDLPTYDSWPAADGANLREFLRINGKRGDLLLHLRLYVMGDKYDVPPLRLLARDRFYREAEIYYETLDAFPDVVDELYSTTPETDVAMREIACRLTATSIANGAFKVRMDPVMRKHGDFAVGVLNCCFLTEGAQR